MSRISDRFFLLMHERWRDSIRPEHAHDPNWWKRQSVAKARGDIIAPFPAEGALNQFWEEFLRPAGWGFA
jgi:hypothetical protein